MSKAQQTLKGLRALTVLFLHPRENLLEEFHVTKARFLDLKYAKAFIVPGEKKVVTAEDGATVEEQPQEWHIRTVLVPHNGLRVQCPIQVLPMESDSLLNALVASIDLVYHERTQALVDRLQA
jgi:hypothetical protein